VPKFVADSVETTGLKWVAASFPTFVGARAIRSASLNVVASTDTTVNFDSENFDSDGFHSLVTNTERFTVPSGKAGKYRINVGASFVTNSNGMRGYYIFKNASTILAYGITPGANAAGAQITGQTVLADLAVGDYVWLQIFHNSTTTPLAIEKNAYYWTFFELELVGA